RIAKVDSSVFWGVKYMVNLLGISILAMKTNLKNRLRDAWAASLRSGKIEFPLVTFNTKLDIFNPRLKNDASAGVLVIDDKYVLYALSPFKYSSSTQLLQVPLSRWNTRPTNTSVVSLVNLGRFIAYVEKSIVQVSQVLEVGSSKSICTSCSSSFTDWSANANLPDLDDLDGVTISPSLDISWLSYSDFVLSSPVLSIRIRLHKFRIKSSIYFIVYLVAGVLVIDDKYVLYALSPFKYSSSTQLLQVPLIRWNTRPTNTSVVSLVNLGQFIAYVEKSIELDDLDGGLPLVDSLYLEDFFEDSASFLILIFFVSLHWFSPA
nr:hypothetical protein [Tanacetum cinerariifolium]